MEVITYSFIAIIVLNGFRIKFVEAEAIKYPNLAVGWMEPKDKLILNVTKAHDPGSGLELESIRFAVSSKRHRFAYIMAEESGDYPDARVHVFDGGPGRTFFVLDFISGPLGGWNYTVTAYGHVRD